MVWSENISMGSDRGLEKDKNKPAWPMFGMQWDAIMQEQAL